MKRERRTPESDYFRCCGTRNFYAPVDSLESNVKKQREIQNGHVYRHYFLAYLDKKRAQN